jgi:hypothetical protein
VQAAARRAIQTGEKTLGEVQVFLRAPSHFARNPTSTLARGALISTVSFEQKIAAALGLALGIG